MQHLSFALLLLLAWSCMRPPAGRFSEAEPPAIPNYGETENWAALPERADSADITPLGFPDQQASAEVDVFYLHPTIYDDASQNRDWNGDVANQKLNREVDESAMRFQASAFNGVGRVYAPRYRLAHLSVFYPKKVSPAESKRALALAYSDVRAAFRYYLKHYNNDRPIIIAAHSQGARHAETLLGEFFDGKPMQEKLVAAYIVGWPVKLDAFENIPICAQPEQTGCFCSWRTYREGYIPKYVQRQNNIAVVNPISWTTSEALAPKSDHYGAVLQKMKIYPNMMEARITEGVLWTNKPKFPGSFLFTRRNYHIGDINLFYLDIRENAQVRTEAYFEGQ